MINEIIYFSFAVLSLIELLLLAERKETKIEIIETKIIKQMIIELIPFDESKNTDAILDSGKPFDEQTVVCKSYVMSKQNSTEHKPLILDDNNRPSIRVNDFEDGFSVVFQQNYKNAHNYLTDPETVTSITI